MRTIAIMSPKGGVGKTTTADSISYIIASKYKKKVIILDGDPQSDTSRNYGVYEAEGIGMSELLENHKMLGGLYTTNELIQHTKYSNIDIIPANGYLMKTDIKLLIDETDSQITRLREALKEIENEYDYCICDCGRLFDMIVLNMIVAAELVIAPVKCGGFEVEALQNLETQVNDLLDINPYLRVKGLMVMKQKNNVHRDIKEWLDMEYDMFDTAVRRSLVAEKATMEPAPVPAFSKHCTVTNDYIKVVKELFKDLEG